MDNYYCAVLERYLGNVERAPEARQRVYDLARGAVERTFSTPDRLSDRADELAKLESAILTIEAGFIPVPMADSSAQDSPYQDLPLQDSHPPQHIAPEEHHVPEVLPEALPAVETEAWEAAACAPIEAAPVSLPPPHASLFTNDQPPEPVYIMDESSPAEDRLIDRLKVLALLVTLGIGAYLYFVRTQPPAPEPLRSTVANMEPTLVIDHNATPVRFEGAEGKLAWSEGRDPPSISLRDARKPVLRGTGSAGPNGPQVAIVALPSDSTPFPRGDMVEFRLVGGTPGIAALVSLKMSLRDGSQIEPDGVIVRSGPGSYALVFAQDAVARDVGRTLLRNASRMSLMLTREDNSTREIEIGLPPVFARQFGGAAP